MARAKGEGTYERRKSDLQYRFVLQADKKRLVGPFKPTKSEALKAWKEKQKQPPKSKPKSADPFSQPDRVCIGDEIYWCLFGVWDSPDGERPTTKGIWADELAPTTYQLYFDAFKARIRHDPIALMDPAEVDVRDLESFRSRLLHTPSSYTRKLKTKKPDGSIEVKDLIVERPPLNGRSVMRYMTPVFKVLKRHRNLCYRELGTLKLNPPKKAWLTHSDRDAFLALMNSPMLRRAALLMMHGMSIGEVCKVTSDAFDGHTIEISEQTSMIGGKAVDRGQLKRARRYRKLPANRLLKQELAGVTGRLVDFIPSSLRRAIERKVAGTKFENIGPHDLRRSGGKWMLDAGAKLSDVAAILGNDPRTLLVWYDTSDAEGKARAIEAV